MINDDLLLSLPIKSKLHGHEYYMVTVWGFRFVFATEINIFCIRLACNQCVTRRWIFLFFNSNKKMLKPILCVHQLGLLPSGSIPFFIVGWGHNVKSNKKVKSDHYAKLFFVYRFQKVYWILIIWSSGSWDNL